MYLAEPGLGHSRMVVALHPVRQEVHCDRSRTWGSAESLGALPTEAAGWIAHM